MTKCDKRVYLDSILPLKFEEMSDEDAEEERQGLIGNHLQEVSTQQFKTFKRRWIVLLLFSSLSFLQVKFVMLDLVAQRHGDNMINY